ncbi:hypothetical protein TIFTF001_017149 [Ficus carica]|uniref:Uncharacterized protein n=1 Tax=Ficus carica TaxID=3494 RepID=A0AA88A7I5_FICCA|nr:hypothetical protein TIFTF001_017149 [Ficus carica]
MSISTAPSPNKTCNRTPTQPQPLPVAHGGWSLVQLSMEEGDVAGQDSTHHAPPPPAVARSDKGRGPGGPPPPPGKPTAAVNTELAPAPDALAVLARASIVAASTVSNRPPGSNPSDAAIAATLPCDSASAAPPSRHPAYVVPSPAPSSLGCSFPSFV